MPGVFDTSASEIANYRSDPANALGGDAGASNLLGETNASGISDALKVIAAANLQKNKAIYDKKIKDQEDLFKELSSSDVQLKQMLPNDRDFLWKNFRDPIRKLVMDPDVTTDYKKAAAVQEKLNDFKEAKAYTAVRLTAINELDKSIAAERDPIRRKRMEDHRNAMYNQSIYDQVKPFQEGINFSKNTLVDPGVKEDPVSTTMEGNQEVVRTHRYSPWAKFTEGVYWNYLSNPDVKVKSEMDAMAQSVHEMPADQKKWLVDSWNEKINKGNADNNLKEGEKDYVPPVRYDIIKDDQGQDQVVIHATTPEIVRAQSIYDNYHNEVHTESKFSKLPSEIRENDAQAQSAKALAYYRQQQATKLLPAQVANYRAQANKHNTDALKVREEIKKIKQDTNAEDWNINQLKQSYDPAKYQNSPDAKVLGIPGVSGKLIATNTPTSGTPLVNNLSDEEMVYLSESFNINGKKSTVKPEAVVYNMENTKDPYFLNVYKIPKADKTGFNYETRIVRPNIFLQKVISASGGSGAEFRKTMTKWKQLTGKDNINGSLFSEYDKEDWKEKKTKLDEFMK